METCLKIKQINEHKELELDNVPLPLCGIFITQHVLMENQMTFLLWLYYEYIILLININTRNGEVLHNEGIWFRLWILMRQRSVS